MTNVLQHPEIIVLNFDLIKDVLTPEKLNVLHKHTGGPYEVFYSLVKKGIVFSEDNIWKKKKKLLSKVFNYDFITSQIPDMVTIADQVFD